VNEINDDLGLFATFRNILMPRGQNIMFAALGCDNVSASCGWWYRSD